MIENCQELLRRIQILDFNIIDLHLYLDTHQYDQRAINIYNNYVRQVLMLKQQYQHMCGPLTANSFISGYPWPWINEPWPWERGGN